MTEGLGRIVLFKTILGISIPISTSGDFPALSTADLNDRRQPTTRISLSQRLHRCRRPRAYEASLRDLIDPFGRDIDLVIARLELGRAD